MASDRELLSRSSLRVAAQWRQWLDHHLEAFDVTDPQVRLIRDTLICCMHNLTNCARRIRGNPGWDMSGTLRDDTVNLHDEMLTARKMYLDNRLPMERQPAKLANLYFLTDGIVNQQVRLAREVTEMRDTGALNIDVTTDRRTGQIIERLN